MLPATTAWRPWQKITFRFFFLSLGASSSFCWVLLIFFSSAILGKPLIDPLWPFKSFAKPSYWLDHHLFHTGYDPKLHDPFPQDNHFGVVFYLAILLMAIIGTMIWTLADRRRPNYNRLNYWFRVYLRYVLALTMFGYGIDKFIPVQMRYPNVSDLLTPLGEIERFKVLWNFMGLAPGYMILTGASEILGSLLLWNRRTLVLGYLVQLAILINVVAFNVFYNVPVKMFSTQLLIYTLFLLTPFGYQLIRLFFFGQPVAFHEQRYILRTKWKRNFLSGVLVGLPLIVIGCNMIGGIQRYKKNQANLRSQKIYGVTAFVAKDTLPPLVTDTLRWKRLLMVNGNNAIVCNMQDGNDYYECTVDSNKKTWTLHDSPDTLSWHVFTYSYPAKDQLSLTGKWKGQPVSILMRSEPADSLPINKEKIKWVND